MAFANACRDFLTAISWDWVKIHKDSEGPALKYSWVWLSIVPFLTGYVKPLPINLQFFYLSAVLFGIGLLVYRKRCPELIKEAPNFGEFQARGHSQTELRNWFHAVASMGRQKPSPALIKQYLEIASNNPNIDAAQAAELNAGKAGDALMIPFWGYDAGHRLQDVHFFAVGIARSQRLFSRAAVTTIYFLGFCVFAVVVGLNGWKMYRYYYPKSPQDIPIVSTAEKPASKSDAPLALSGLPQSASGVGANTNRPTTRRLDSDTSEIWERIESANSDERAQAIAAIENLLRLGMNHIGSEFQSYSARYNSGFQSAQGGYVMEASKRRVENRLFFIKRGYTQPAAISRYIVELSGDDLVFTTELSGVAREFYRTSASTAKFDASFSMAFREAVAEQLETEIKRQ